MLLFSKPRHQSSPVLWSSVSPMTSIWQPRRPIGWCRGPREGEAGGEPCSRGATAGGITPNIAGAKAARRHNMRYGDRHGAGRPRRSLRLGLWRHQLPSRGQRNRTVDCVIATAAGWPKARGGCGRISGGGAAYLCERGVATCTDTGTQSGRVHAAGGRTEHADQQ